ncbi:MAG: hypothetical protein WC119_01845 [Synergistaceae bacterium]
MPKNEQNLSVQDLRAIIHGLRMKEFSIDDEDASDQIHFMIKGLPTPETLDSMVNAPGELKDVQDTVGEIMRLIELGGRRDESFKVRYEAKKDMPPRYKVLTWRTAMNQNDLTKKLIKASVYADEKNEPLVAEQALKLAKKVRDGAVTDEDILSFNTAISKTSLEKEAGMGEFMAGLKGGLGGAMQGAKNFGHAVAGDPFSASKALAKARYWMGNVVKGLDGLKESLNGAINFVYDTKMKSDLQNVLGIVNDFGSNAPQLSQQLNSFEMDLKRQWSPIPTEQGGQAGQSGQAAQGAQGTEGAQGTIFDQTGQPQVNPQRAQELQDKMSVGDVAKAVLPGGPDADVFNPSNTPSSGGGVGGGEPAVTGVPSTMEGPSGAPAGTPEAPAGAPTGAPTFNPGQKVKYRTRGGADKAGTVKQVLPNGKVQVQLDGGGLVPADSKELALACERYRIHKQAQSKRWVRIV